MIVLEVCILASNIQLTVSLASFSAQKEGVEMGMEGGKFKDRR